MSARASGLENAPLFREEALARFRGSAWQPALLSKPVSGYLLAASAVVAGAGLVGFATTFEFARKEQVQGYLTPAAGWARVAAKSFGVVRRRHVAPGDRVQAGDVLLEVSSGDGLQRSLTVQERMIEEIDGRRATLDARLSMVAAEYRNNLELLTRQNESERHELARLNEEIGLSEAQVQIAQQRYRNGRRLLSSGALPQAGLVELEEEEQARRLSLSERRREAGRLRASLATNDARVERLTLERNLKQAAIQEQLHALAMESSRIRGEDSSRLLAPRDGLVATVRVRPGDSVRPGDILLDILPADSVLQARLFAPAAAMGFVAAGQEVRVYLDAFPYERHGAQQGRVLSISETAMTPTGAGAGQGLTGLHYQVDVAFPSGVDLPAAQLRALRPGMTLTADLVRDHSTLLDWLLEPLRGTAKRL